MTELIFLIAGFLLSWLIAHFYYHRSSTQIPNWAKPVIENLPEQPPSKVELLRLFQEHLDSGEIEVHPALGCVACPDCGESSQNFKEKVYGDDAHTIVAVTCPSCGWSENAEV